MTSNTSPNTELVFKSIIKNTIDTCVSIIINIIHRRRAKLHRTKDGNGFLLTGGAFWYIVKT